MTGLESDRAPGVRLEGERADAESGELNPAQFELLSAVETWKRVNRRHWPSFTEVLEILRQLGYRKVLPRSVKISAPEPDLEVPVPAAQ